MSTETTSLDDLEMGDEIAPIERVITREQVVQFLKLGGRWGGATRFNDPEIARREGLPGPIVPGGLSMAFLSQFIARRLPNASLRKLDAVFRQVVLHNAPVHIRGVVTDKKVVDGEPQLELDVLTEDTGGQVLIAAQAVVGFEAT